MLFHPINLSKLSNNLYQSGCGMLTDVNLSKYKITHVVNCAYECEGLTRNLYPKYKVLNLLLNDDLRQKLYPANEIAFDFINDAINNGGVVLVNCYAGISRSSSIILYYLMKKYNYDLRDALSILRLYNKSAEPNPNFVEQLSQMPNR